MTRFRTPYLPLALAVPMFLGACSRGDLATHSPPKSADLTQASAEGAVAGDTLEYSVSYDERAHTLDAYARRHDWTEVSGDFAADGVAMPEEPRLLQPDPAPERYGYGILRKDVAATDSLTTTITYTGGNDKESTKVALARIEPADSVGEFSLSQGFSFSWLGAPLQPGEEVEVQMRDHADHADYAETFSAWGQVGTANTVLWIDGNTLRVPPIAAWTGNTIPLTVGLTYEIWLRRALRAANVQAEYLSRSINATLAP